MKRFLLMIFVFATLAANAQLRKIPAEVTEAFKAKFPNAEKVEWKDKLTYFEAGFQVDNIHYTADFNSDGEWKETDKEITFEELPEAIKDGFKKSKYADWDPGSVVLINKKDKDPQYRIYAEKSSLVQKKYLYFDTNGQLQREALTL